MLDIQYTEEGLKDLNYVVVSGKPKKGSDPEIRGLFLGIKSIEPEEDNLPAKLFLWMYNNDTIFILNLQHYTISSMEVCIHKYGKKSQIINFKDSEYCSAIAKLHIIQNTLTNQKRVRTDGLIEVSTYKDLPEYLAKMAPKQTVVEDSNKSTTSAVKSNTYRKKTYNTKTKQWDYENTISKAVNYTPNPYHSNKKKVETSVFKRTTRYPAENAIANMKTKIEEIKLGKYKPAKLKKIPADDVKKEEKEEKKEKDAGNKVTGNMTEEEAQDLGMYGYGV